MVPPIQMASASARNTRRNDQPESSGNCDSFCAISTWNGLIGLKAAPTAAAPTLIAAAVTASYPRRRVSTSSAGMSAMISSCMLSSAPPNANTRHVTGMTNAARSASRRTSQSTPYASAPVRSTTANAPPMRNTKNTTSAASSRPFGIATTAANGPTGFASTV